MSSDWFAIALNAHGGGKSAPPRKEGRRCAEGGFKGRVTEEGAFFCCSWWYGSKLVLMVV